MQTREHLALGQELVLQDVDMPVLKRKRLQRIVNAELRMLDLVTAPIPPCPRRRMIHDDVGKPYLTRCISMFMFRQRAVSSSTRSPYMSA